MSVPIAQLTYRSANTSQHDGSDSFTALNFYSYIFIFSLKLAVV